MLTVVRSRRSAERFPDPAWRSWSSGPNTPRMSSVEGASREVNENAGWRRLKSTDAEWSAHMPRGLSKQWGAHWFEAVVESVSSVEAPQHGDSAASTAMCPPLPTQIAKPGRVARGRPKRATIMTTDERPLSSICIKPIEPQSLHGGVIVSNPTKGQAGFLTSFPLWSRDGACLLRRAPKSCSTYCVG